MSSQPAKTYDEINASQLGREQLDEVLHEILEELTPLEQALQKKIGRRAQLALKVQHARARTGTEHRALSDVESEEAGCLASEVPALQQRFDYLKQQQRRFASISQALHHSERAALEVKRERLSDLKKRQQRLLSELAPDREFDRKMAAATEAVERAVRELESLQNQRREAEAALAALRPEIEALEREIGKHA